MIMIDRRDGAGDIAINGDCLFGTNRLVGSWGGVETEIGEIGEEGMGVCSERGRLGRGEDEAV